MPDHYTLLGIARTATAQEIKLAYRRLVAQYHPDLNPDPHASDITATLNQAYAVLSDDGRRKAYDAELASENPWQLVGPEYSRWAASSLPQIQCQNCGRRDSTLRFSRFWYTLSFVLVLHRGAVSGVWCEKCRVVEAAKWSLLSGFAGWWGIPWGPIRTIQDLAVNSRGGEQSARRNAALLRSLAYEFYQHDNFREAFRALRESLEHRPDPGAMALLAQLQSRVHAPASRRASPWTHALGVPALFVALIWAGIIFGAAWRLGGYASSRRGRSALTVESEPISLAETNREIVRSQIARLASIVAALSPAVGSHYEGSTLVTDYGVDRSRFDPGQIYVIAQTIRSAVKPGAPDGDGFMASAYFNSMLFALSVDIVKRIYQGKAIEVQTAESAALGTDARDSAWLRGSRFWPRYQALRAVLQGVSAGYQPGLSVEEMETQVELIGSTLQGLRSQQTLFQAEDNISGYNALVPVYNRDLAHLRTLSRHVQARIALARQLSDAFNHCLDSSILFSRAGHAHLTSQAAGSQAKP